MSLERQPLVIVAGQSGRHARVVFEAARLSGWAVAGVVNPGGGEAPDVFGSRILGGEALLSDERFLSEVAVTPAMGDNATRLRIAKLVGDAGGTLASIVHPASVISGSATVGPGCVVLAGAVVATHAKLGPVCIVNHGASVGHDCTLGAGVNVCSGARLAGAVVVGEGAFIGLNASVIQGRRLGERSTAGAGAVVTRDVAAGTTVVGVPARELARPKQP